LPEFKHLDFWLADLDGLCRVLLHGRGARDAGMPKPAYNYGSMGAVEKDAFAYLTRRPADGRDEATGRERTELGVCAYGAAGAELAERVAGRIRAWHRDLPAISELWVEAHPQPAAGAGAARSVIDKPHTQLRVCTTP
jgi:protein-L-isoaspartate(D-aspartate) O-methyltransferase